MRIVTNPAWHGTADIATIPRRFDAEGRTLYASRNTVKLIDGIVVKRFKRLSPLHSLAYDLTTGGKAMRAYRNAIEMERRGIATPRSIAYIEDRHCGFTAYSYYICEPDWGEELKETLDVDTWDPATADTLAAFFASLHAKGILHHDLNRTNILVHRDGESISFSLIDNNRMTFLPEGQEPELRDCLLNMFRYTERQDVVEHVLRRYCRLRGIDEAIVPKALLMKRKRDEAYTRRKRILHCLTFKR